MEMPGTPYASSDSRYLNLYGEESKFYDIYRQEDMGQQFCPALGADNYMEVSKLHPTSGRGNGHAETENTSAGTGSHAANENITCLLMQAKVLPWKCNSIACSVM